LDFRETISERFPAALPNHYFKNRGTHWIFGKQYLSVSRPPAKPPILKTEAPIGFSGNNI
jgi:hypothetical protein